MSEKWITFQLLHCGDRSESLQGRSQEAKVVISFLVPPGSIHRRSCSQFCTLNHRYLPPFKDMPPAHQYPSPFTCPHPVHRCTSHSWGHPICRCTCSQLHILFTCTFYWVHGQCPLSPWTLYTQSMDNVYSVHGQCPLCPLTISTETMDNVHWDYGQCPLSPWTFSQDFPYTLLSILRITAIQPN